MFVPRPSYHDNPNPQYLRNPLSPPPMILFAPYLVWPQLQVQRSGNGKITKLEEHDPHNQEDKNDIHPGD